MTSKVGLLLVVAAISSGCLAQMQVGPVSGPSGGPDLGAELHVGTILGGASVRNIDNDLGAGLELTLPAPIIGAHVRGFKAGPMGRLGYQFIGPNALYYELGVFAYIQGAVISLAYTGDNCGHDGFQLGIGMTFGGD